MCRRVQATNVTGVGSRPSIVDVALLFYPLNSLNSSSTLVMSAPMTFGMREERDTLSTLYDVISMATLTLTLLALSQRTTTIAPFARPLRRARRCMPRRSIASSMWERSSVAGRPSSLALRMPIN